MKILCNNKILFKLIVALCIFLTLISFGCPSEVHADWLFDTAILQITPTRKEFEFVETNLNKLAEMNRMKG